MRKKFCLLFIGIVILSQIYLGLLVYFKEENTMEYYNYTDLGITSSILPENMHLIIETSSAGTMYMVKDEAVYNEVWKTTDKGENWAQVEERAATAYIMNAWHDRTNEVIYFAEMETNTKLCNFWQLDYGDADNITEYSTIGGGVTSMIQPDIFVIGASLYCVATDRQAVNDIVRVYKWGGAAWAEDANWTAVGTGYTGPVVVIGTDAYMIFTNISLELPNCDVNVLKFDSTVPSLGSVDLTIDNGDKYHNSKNFIGLAYDGVDKLYFSLYDDSDTKYYLYYYSIGSDTSALVQETNVCSMIDRNTASGIMEKGIHISQYRVYELHSVLAYQWLCIAVLDSDAAFIGITDHFLMNSDGDMWEWEDVSSYVINCLIVRKDMNIPTATFDLINTYPLSKGMFIKIKDTFTTATVTATATIFEGYVESFSNLKNQVAVLVSPAKELFDIRPSGTFSGRSDQIISSLISTYCKYITAGTLSAGGAMGDIDFYGDKTMFQILNDLAWFDNFIWYLTPSGELYYNSGAVDSGEDLTTSSHLSEVLTVYGKRAINYVLIKGAYISGTQVKSDGSHDNDDDIMLNGINPLERTHSHLDTAALCNTCATNVLTRFGTQAYIVDFGLRDSTIGMIQEGETLTITYTAGQVAISETQFGIREVIYNARTGLGKYKVSDRIL